MTLFPLTLAWLSAAALWSGAIIFMARSDAARHSRVPRLLRIWGGTACLGLVGLGVGIMRFPESNLLGGYGPVFGPLWMAGGPMALLLVVLLLRQRRKETSHAG